MLMGRLAPGRHRRAGRRGDDGARPPGARRRGGGQLSAAARRGPVDALPRSSRLLARARAVPRGRSPSCSRHGARAPRGVRERGQPAARARRRRAAPRWGCASPSAPAARGSCGSCSRERDPLGRARASSACSSPRGAARPPAHGPPRARSRERRGGPDLRVLGFSTSLSLATAALVGLVPGGPRHARRPRDHAARPRARASPARSGARSAARAARARAWAPRRPGLVIVHAGRPVARAARRRRAARASVRNLQHAPLGLARDRLLLVDVDTRAGGTRRRAFHALCRALAERIARCPASQAAPTRENASSAQRGVHHARVDGYVPAHGRGHQRELRLGRDPVLPRDRRVVSARTASSTRATTRAARRTWR
jgi:hypothetical protein